MEAKHQHLLRRMVEAEKRLALIHRSKLGLGDESSEPEDVMGIRRWRAKGISKKAQQFAAKALANFHIPIARSYRHTNVAGATSFHFAHRFVNRVEHAMCEDGLRNRPNAARSHARYIEREAAVAHLDGDERTRNSGDGCDAPIRSASEGEASKHDQYVIRPGATAIRPGGSLALITNIDADEEERAQFWSLVEKHEAVANADEMSLRIADQPEFWARVLRCRQCPDELREALEQAPPDDLIRFKISSGKMTRRFLATQSGWVKPGAPSRDDEGNLDLPFAKFHDGRKGRTQYRVVGELPDELGVEERFRIVQQFSALFTERRLPFVAVMHAPDHHNDERNWHFHLIYHDRPSGRISQGDINRLRDQGFRTEELKPGMWDFVVTTPKRHRKNGKATPLKQNKNREVTSKGWLEMLRGELAAITNDGLASAGVARRVDPRSFAEMGILADPQQHLGTKQAAAETRGGITPTGVENERRQWAAIVTATDERLARDLQAVRDASGSSPTLGRADASTAQQSNQEAMEAAVHLEIGAFRLQQSIERAQSRALHVRRANYRLLGAYEADPEAGTSEEQDIASALVDASSVYLANLQRALHEEMMLIDECRATVGELRKRRSSEHWLIKAQEGPQQNLPAEEDQRGASHASPDLVVPRNARGSRADEPVRELEGASRPMNEAARKAAMMAALQERSRGR